MRKTVLDVSGLVVADLTAQAGQLALNFAVERKGNRVILFTEDDWAGFDPQLSVKDLWGEDAENDDSQTDDDIRELEEEERNNSRSD